MCFSVQRRFFLPSMSRGLFFSSCTFPIVVYISVVFCNATDVTLTCQAPNNNIIVKWSRADLGAEYVLLYRDDYFVPENQHPSFKNRVDLLDREMKDGDVSLILKNVTINDTGTYECRVVQIGTKYLKLELSVCVIRGEAASWLLMFVSKDVVDETL
uniref:Ig-like domain-containing protein n=1 Tax=Astatotilapia calliptera TaxID=8154 RepID=A0A3P8N755_ASTCA